MNGFNTTRLLGIVFVGLLGVFALFGLSQHNTPVEALHAPQDPEIFPGIDPTQITQISVENRQSGRKVTLIKVPGDWTATDEKGAALKPDLNLVAKMLQIL